MRPQRCSASRILLVPDGDIPTTAIVEAVLNDAMSHTEASRAAMADLSVADIDRSPVLFSRVCAPEMAWLPRWMRSYGACYAYYLDDDLWQYRADNEVARYYSLPETRHSLEQFILRASLVVVNSAVLAERIRTRFPGANVQIVPPPFDFSAVETQECPASPAGAPLRVGYAGTERGDAFASVVTAIEHLLIARPGRFSFEFIGYIPDSLRGRSDVLHFPGITDYREFLKFKQSRQWEVGLAPLTDDEFSKAKTNNKFREYGALSIAGIYSDVSPYRDCVLHGVNGWLVPNTPEAWIEALSILEADRALCRATGREARQSVWDVHRMEKVASAWSAVLEQANLLPAQAGLRGRIDWWISKVSARLSQRARMYRAINTNAGFFSLVRHFAARTLTVLGMFREQSGRR